jgi:hypothetical protein
MAIGHAQDLTAQDDGYTRAPYLRISKKTEKGVKFANLCVILKM